MNAMKQFLGIQGHATSAERFVASLGGGLCIFLIAAISYAATDLQGTAAILPSMGAAAVLLFAVPHGPLSQPWALIGGNVLSAVIGVSCALLLKNTYLSASLAVGLSIAIMHIFRCVHPPGGATALAAVIGGDSITHLGYLFVIYPTLLNVSIMLVTAMIFNNSFSWRSYPQSMLRFQPVTTDRSSYSEQEIQNALEKMDMVLDVSPQYIGALIKNLEELRGAQAISKFELALGKFYTNGKPGREWSVRQIVDMAPHKNPAYSMIIYKVVAGNELRRSDSCTQTEFALWAKDQLQPAKKPLS